MVNIHLKRFSIMQWMYEDRDTDAKQSRSDFVVIILLVIPSGKSAQTIND